jgi:hypothetical protein
MAINPKIKGLPQQVYVKVELNHRDSTEPYLVASATLDTMSNGEVVGVYELKETRTLHVTRELK